MSPKIRRFLAIAKVSLITCVLLVFVSNTNSVARAVTFDEIATKIAQAADAIENAYLLYQMPGYDIDGDGTPDTLTTIDTKYSTLSADQRGQMRAENFCV